MKKILLFLTVMLAIVGTTLAQDVYYSGYYTKSGQDYATVYKNGAKLYEKNLGDLDSWSTSVVVDPATNDVYWTRCNSSYGDVFKNDNIYLNQSTGTYIHKMCWSTYFEELYSAGYRTGSDSKKYATIWGGDNITPFLAPNFENGKESEAYDVKDVKTAPGTYYTYYCGYANATESGSPRATVWKGNNVLYTLSTVNSNAISLEYYNGSVYTVGYVDNDNNSSNRVAKVWKNDDVLYTLTTPGTNVNVYKIKVDCGDVWVIGYGESRAPVCVWKNGQVIQTMGTQYTAKGLDVNTTGYYATYNGDYQPKVYKNGSVLYESTPDCKYIYDLFVTEPEGNPETRTLPYFEGFEMGETDWNSWTVIDDEDGSYMFDYWQRYGRRGSGFEPATGDYCGMHWSRSGYSEEGWLISPKLFLQPGRDYTYLTFKSYESNPSSYVYEGVWVSTTNTNPSSFTEVWSQTAGNASSSWKDITVNLNAYQGQTIYIAFKYTNNGSGGHGWLIDDVSVTEGWTPCSNLITSYPWIEDFEEGYEPGSCWYILDNDHTGELRCWQLDGTQNCAKHPYGQDNGISQEGWMISSEMLQLTAGKNYTLSFQTSTGDPSYFSSGGSSVWIAVDKTGTPNPADYTQIWVETDPIASWKTVALDLSAYAGHTVSIAFKYEGIFAHVWYVDDITMTEALPQFNINVEANNAAYGTVSGGGTFDQGATCTITATANSGYEFKKWTKDGSDVSTSESYTFTVTEDATYVAVFGEPAVTYYTVNTAANPAAGGTVTGGGTYASGTEVTLTATPNEGYEFVKWNDNNTANPRTITVTGDVTYTAQFSLKTYNLSVSANPVTGGNVTGGGNYPYGEYVTITATPNEGYQFLNWNDGVTQASRTVRVIGDATYVAHFADVTTTTYTVTVVSGDPTMGSVSGGGTYPEGTEISISASPFGINVFKKWDDGNTDNPRTVTVTADVTYTAIFETPTLYTITVVSLNPEMGSVSGGGNFPMGAEVTIQANPLGGYYFDGWTDNNYDNPRTVTVTGNATYSAKFSAQQAETFMLTVTCNPMHGYVEGGGNYLSGTNVTVTAVPYDGYEFDHWNDNVTQNPRTVTVSNNMTLVAFFKATGVGENGETVMSLYPNPAKESIRLKGIEANSEVVIYNTLGMMVKTVNANAEQEIGVSDLAAGVYTVRCGHQVLRFVKE